MTALLEALAISAMALAAKTIAQVMELVLDPTSADVTKAGVACTVLSRWLSPTMRLKPMASTEMILQSGSPAKLKSYLGL